MLKKCVNNIRGSLNVRIFLITVLILAAACGATYGFIAWATPLSYTSIVSSDLRRQTDRLLNDLQDTAYEDSGPLFDRFLLNTGAYVQLRDMDGRALELPGSLAVEAASGSAGESTTDMEIVVSSDNASAGASESHSAPGAADAASVYEDTAVRPAAPVASGDGDAVSSVTVTDNGASDYPFSFLGDDQVYYLTVIATVTAVNQAVEALGKVLPWLVLVVLAICLLGAVFYSRYITRPIVRLSRISQRMADLDFTWKCQDARADEIGTLGRSLNALSDRLDAALSELQTANDALRRDIDRERELERQRTTFFSAASHELKTPITILRGQLSGMLAGVDVYRDRDKYLARALSVTGRMERLVQEILTVSRMENAAFVLRREPVDLSALVREQAGMLRDLAEQRRQTVYETITPGIVVSGDGALLERAAANLLSNASVHAPEGAAISVTLSAEDGATLTVTNGGVQIPEEALPRLFEAFYRVDASRSRETGGSGLGLYLTGMILERHGASCRMENTPDGVRAVARFPSAQLRLPPAED